MRAVKRFQRAAQLTPSGTVGRKTLAALQAASKGTSANVANGGTAATIRSKSRGAKSLGDRVPVKKGMHGHDIRVLQDLLGNAGYDVTIDGEFGSGTLDAVEKFEGEHQRPVDGALDADDIATLRAAAAAGPATVAAPAVNTGPKATVGPDGLAVAPAGAPPQVVRSSPPATRSPASRTCRAAATASGPTSGYDCSGSVSFALARRGPPRTGPGRRLASRTGAIPAPASG